jgi:F-type H+-transporting ATPase subunit delta
MEEKPRNLTGVLKSYQRLIRLEEEKRHAVIESTVPLNRDLGQEIVNRLKIKHGPDVTTEFRTNPELLSGICVRIGDDVFDGSGRNRLKQLEKQI